MLVVLVHNLVVRQSTKIKKQETLRVVTIVMICFTLPSFWKFQYFRRPVYNPVEDLWWSFYCENSKPLRIFTKKLRRRCSLGFNTLQTIYFFKEFYIVRLLKSVFSLNSDAVKIWSLNHLTYEVLMKGHWA